MRPELFDSVLFALRTGATGPDGFLGQEELDKIARLWRTDSLAVEQTLARLITDERLATRREAMAAVTAYRQLSGRLGPLVAQWSRGWGRWPELLLATRAPESPELQAIVDAMACTAAWHLATYADLEPSLHDGRVLWRPNWELVIQFAWPLMTPELRERLERGWLARAPDSEVWLPR